MTERENLPSLVFMEDPFLVEEIPRESPPPVAPSRTVGTPFDPARHPEAFRRDWSKTPGAIRHVPWTPPVVAPPLVPARPVTADDLDTIAGAACTAIARAVAVGLTVRATYAQGGTPRPRAVRGACPTCAQVVALFAESSDTPGMLHDHTVGGTPCPGDARSDAGLCLTCNREVAAKKNGAPRAHKTPSTPCPAGGHEPARIIVPEPAPPVRSVIVRIGRAGAPLAVAAWRDQPDGKWKLDATYLVVTRRGQRIWAEASAADFDAAIAAARADTPSPQAGGGGGALRHPPAPAACHANDIDSTKGVTT